MHVCCAVLCVCVCGPCAVAAVAVHHYSLEESDEMSFKVCEECCVGKGIKRLSECDRLHEVLRTVCCGHCFPPCTLQWTVACAAVKAVV